MLATDEGDLDMVDPNQVSSSERDSIATPNVLRIKLSDVHVLDDNILCTIGDPQPLSTDDAGFSNANNGLVRLDVYVACAGFIVSD